ncbi:MAG TPA: general secretion pathway protein GspB [Candidatus Omnitrophota bacterium]|nr:general secretion pathway protein GspB [Candidatus Omnitrophota bacterium]HPD84004.1 general secretion pathway protein GspB [Candidatus Omnitrophota bacterium]HRZ02861.1 general secretion pathway protein GspB [Candidatus Omnitrophota bacterium]
MINTLKRRFYLAGGCFALGFVFLFSVAGVGLAENVTNSLQGKKRDPFVALVNSNGTIKRDSELFPAPKLSAALMDIVLKAIIWDEKRPLAMINTKVYSEGMEITQGLKVEKIYPNSVLLNDNGNPITIQLRKTVKR